MAATTPTMTVKGLNKDAFFINNPIWVDITYISNQAEYVLVKISEAGNNLVYNYLNLYPVNGNTYFDLSEVVKGYMKEPEHPESLFNGADIETNYIKLLIQFWEVDANGTPSNTISFTKDFIRGGEESQGHNIGINYNINFNTNYWLTESNLIPTWSGYPLYRYGLVNGGTIKAYSIIPNNEKERRKVVSCNPLYLRFLNTKGGYSFWLFEKWEIEKKSNKTEIIPRRKNSGSTGHKLEYTVTVTSRVERRYYKTMRALIQSAEIHGYNLAKLCFNDTEEATFQTQNITWDRIFNQGSKIKTNNFEDMQEISISFDFNLAQKPSIKW